MNGTPPLPPDLSTLNSQERITYILGVRQRINDGEEVSTDEIKNAVRLIALDRAGSSRGRKGKTPTPVTLADF